VSHDDVLDEKRVRPSRYIAVEDYSEGAGAGGADKMQAYGKGRDPQKVKRDDPIEAAKVKRPVVIPGVFSIV
jgi:hypothetical protein